MTNGVVGGGAGFQLEKVADYGRRRFDPPLFLRADYLRDLDLTVLRREDFLAPLARDFAADFLPDRREDLLPPNFLPPDLAVLRD